MKATIVEMEGLLRGKCVPAKMLVNESLAEYLVRQFDALHQRADKAERERDELRHSDYLMWHAMACKNGERARIAEAELARRDAAAGEPVAYQIHSDLEGWRECTPERYAEMSARPLVEGKHSGGWLVRKLYTDAPPAVLPPEKITEIMQGAWNEFCDDTGCYPDDFEYQNEQLFFDAGHWAMLVAERISSMGAQQQKVVELYKRKSMEVISGQRYSYVLLEDLLPELDAANVKWEVKK